jgi:hypothetical protein
MLKGISATTIWLKNEYRAQQNNLKMVEEKEISSRLPAFWLGPQTRGGTPRVAGDGRAA